MKWLVLCAAGASYGVLSSAGVFTVFAAVGLVPRFVGKTHTARHVTLYEEMIIWGTILGGLASIFYPYYAGAVASFLGAAGAFGGISLQVIYGFFAGIFVGCLALAIAEVLESIPILSMRINFGTGMRLAIWAMAVGKLIGSLYYFYRCLWTTAGLDK